MPFVCLRIFAFLCVALVFVGGARACDMDVSARGQGVADYVETTKPCLGNLPEGYWIDRDMEKGFIREVNAERVKRGLKPLIHRGELLDTVRIHSLDMATNKFFGHEGPDKRFHFDRISAFDRRAILEFSAENVAMLEVVQGPFDFSSTLPKLHKGLMDSPGHRKNILNEKATHVSMGVIRSETGVWVTQVFVELAGTLNEDAPVRVGKGQAIVRQSPYLKEWTFKRVDVQLPSDEFTELTKKNGTFIAGSGLSGEMDLAIYVEMPGPKPGSYVSMRLFGPAVTVSDSTS